MTGVLKKRGNLDTDIAHREKSCEDDSREQGDEKTPEKHQRSPAITRS